MHSLRTIGKTQIRFGREITFFYANFDRMQLSCDNQSVGEENDDAEGDFLGSTGVVLHNSMGTISIFSDLGTIRAR